MIITVTGKVGSGKSTVVKYLAKIIKDANPIDADMIGHTVLQEKKKKIEDSFGKTVIKNGKVDRKKLGELVFSDKKMLSKLNSIIHPKLRERIIEKVKKNKINIIDAALFYELRLNGVSDVVILVRANKQISYNRKGYPGSIIDNIYKTQKVPKRYDFLLVNNGTKRDLYRKIEEMII